MGHISRLTATLRPPTRRIGGCPLSSRQTYQVSQSEGRKRLVMLRIDTLGNFECHGDPSGFTRPSLRGTRHVRQLRMPRRFVCFLIPLRIYSTSTRPRFTLDLMCPSMDPLNKNRNYYQCFPISDQAADESDRSSGPLAARPSCFTAYKSRKNITCRTKETCTQIK